MTASRRAATGSAATFLNNTWCYLINKTLAQMNAERAAGPAGHNLKLKLKNKKNKSASSQAPKRVGPPNKVKGSKLQG